MKPSLLFLLVVIPATVGPTAAQTVLEDKSVLNTLVLQKAMAQAQHALVEANPRKAVDILEGNLTKVGGNASYLGLLREAYRAYINQLWLSHQPELARRYLDRLCVLEPAAASDPKLRPPATTEKRAIAPPEPDPVKKDEPAPLPKFTRMPTPPPKDIDRGPAPSTVRAHADETVDPFDPAFRRPDADADSRLKLATMLVSRADDEFKQNKFPAARALYEQAYAADRTLLAATKDRYAYCLLEQVVGEINRGPLNPASVPTLEKTVAQAIGLAPRLETVGKGILKDIDQRRKDLGASSADAGHIDVQHLGKNKEGWTVAETRHFRIFHRQGPDLAEKVAAIAEGTRLAMYRKWFGHDGVDWTPKCELILHPTGADYQRMTGVPASSPGHSRIESDPTGKRVVARRMDLRLDHPGMLEAVLPHETTHVVLAGMFDGHTVPRWADEGIAVLTEPEDKIRQHRRNLAQSSAAGELFGVKELMELSDYPQPRRISAFYAQAVGLADFLAARKGPTILTQFIRDGLREGYESALRRHYDLDFAALEGHWREYVAASAAVAAAR